MTFRPVRQSQAERSPDGVVSEQNTQGEQSAAGNFRLTPKSRRHGRYKRPLSLSTETWGRLAKAAAKRGITGMTWVRWVIDRQLELEAAPPLHLDDRPAKRPRKRKALRRATDKDVDTSRG